MVAKPQPALSVRSLPKTLYKYLEPTYAEALALNGTVHVGSLRKYRETEDKDPRSDIGEGTRQIRSDAGVQEYTGATLPSEFAQAGIRMHPTARIVLHGQHSITYNRETSDAWIYSTSSLLSDWLLARFGGACIEI